MKDKTLDLTLIQPNIFWKGIESNLEHLDNLIHENKSHSDVIILPEMFTTGFSMDVQNFAEGPQGTTLKWMIEKAVKYNAAITGSIIYSENNHYFNRLYWVNPGGEWQYYDKRHLFRMGNEDQFYQYGKQRLIVLFRGWRICPLICYDLRFPAWSRNNHAYDLLIYVANWPAARTHVWNILLRARAIENQCFVAGINRVGRDGENIHYYGESCVIHPKGYFSIVSHEPVEQVINCTVSLNELLDFRANFPVLKDADTFNFTGL
jgi:omega-amidase